MTYLVAAADAVMTLLTNAKTDLGLGAVFYGDQTKIPSRFTACVEPDSDKAQLQGGFRRVDRTVVIYVLLYDSAIQSTSDNRRESDVKAELIENLLNKNAYLEGFTHCYVTSIESGYAIKDGSVMRSNRITYECTRKSDPLPTS